MHIPRPFLYLVLLLVTAQNVIASCSTPVLTQMPAIPVGTNPMGAALADLDKDGVLDLATPTGPGASSIYVQRGNGDGTFQNGVSYPSGTQNSLRILAADFNGDTWLDLITVNYFSNDLSVLLNNGNGTFAAPLLTSTLISPAWAAIGDANDDGHLDVGVAGDTARIHFGAGNGTFNPQTLTLSPTEGSTKHLAFGDFNRDGRTDVAVLRRPIYAIDETPLPSTLTLYFRQVNGTYTTSTLTLAGNTDGTLLAADLNGDGALDLMTGNSYLLSVSVFVNNNDGTFAPRVDYPMGPEQPSYLVLEDMNEDGKHDLVIGTVNTMGLVMLVGNGDGSFDTTPYKQLITASSYYLQFHAVAAGDLNGDFRPDILLVDSTKDVAFRLHNLCTPRWAGVALSGSPSPSNYGESLELTANMQFRGTVRPTGSISFYKGNTLLGTVPLSETNSAASLFLTKPSLGTHQYTASYSGDATFGASTSPLYTHVVQRGPFGTPHDFTATGDPVPFSVSMSWIGTSDVQTYEVSRMAEGTWTVLGTTSFETYVDHTPPSLGSFFYRVRALGAGGAASGFGVDMASTETFQNTVAAGQTIRIVDLTELRDVVNALRTSAGWPAFSFTDASLSGVRIKAIHLTELRNALVQAMTTAGMTTPFYARSIESGQTVLANDLVEMRAKVR